MERKKDLNLAYRCEDVLHMFAGSGWRYILKFNLITVTALT